MLSASAGRVPAFIVSATWLVCIALCPTSASAAPAGNEMCGDGTTFHVDLPVVDDSPGGGLDHPFAKLLDDSLDLPKGCNAYLLIVSDLGRDRHFNELLLYPLAKFVAEHNGYVHYAWWNNLLKPYDGPPVHAVEDLTGSSANSPGLADLPFSNGAPPSSQPPSSNLGNFVSWANPAYLADFMADIAGDLGFDDAECKYNNPSAKPVIGSILDVLGRQFCTQFENFLVSGTAFPFDRRPFPDSAKQFVADAAAFARRARQENPNAIIVIAGHGLGGHVSGLVSEKLSHDGAVGAIDLLALIDPYASDGVDGSFVDDPLLPGSRARSVNPFRGWARRDCVRGSLNLCKNFGTFFHPRYQCFTRNEVLTGKPLIGSFAPIVCPGSVEIYQPLDIGPATRRFYYRWQNETGPPGDFADGHTYPTGASTGLPSVAAQALVPTVLDATHGTPITGKLCGDPDRADPEFVAVVSALLADLGVTDATLVSNDTLKTLLSCNPFDGHGELVGFRDVTQPTEVVNPLDPISDLIQVLSDLCFVDAICNPIKSLLLNASASITPTVRVPLGLFARHWSEDGRESELKEMATPDPAKVWPHRPLFPELCVVCDDLVAITTDLLIGNGSIGLDDTAPATTAIDHPGANPDGWHAADVQVDLTATDAGSGVKEIEHALSGAQSNADVVTAGAAAQDAITAEGTTTVTFFARDNAGNVETPKTLDVKLDKTPPDVSAAADRDPNQRGWYNRAVLVTFSAADALSGLASVSAPVTVSSEGAGQEIIGTATDKAGNSAAGSLLLSIDQTPPVITLASRLPAANANGWNRTDVTFTWSCADALSGPVSPTVSQSVVAEGLAQTATGTCFDAADNTASDVQTNVSIDKTPPAIVGSRSPSSNANGWNNGPVTASFTCSDALSGLAPGSPPAPTTLTGEGANQSVAGTCVDRADNPASMSVQGINIDLTAPTITIAANSSILWPPNGKPVAVTVSGVIADTLSGIGPTAAFTVMDKYGAVQPSGTVSVASDGHYSFTVNLEAARLGTDRDGRTYEIIVSAEDKAGNPASASTIVLVPHDQGK
jgi:hypothetical protein